MSKTGPHPRTASLPEAAPPGPRERRWPRRTQQLNLVTCARAAAWPHATLPWMLPFPGIRRGTVGPPRFGGRRGSQHRLVSENPPHRRKMQRPQNAMPMRKRETNGIARGDARTGCPTNPGIIRNTSILPHSVQLQLATYRSKPLNLTNIRIYSTTSAPKV